MKITRRHDGDLVAESGSSKSLPGQMQPMSRAPKISQSPGDAAFLFTGGDSTVE